MCQLNSFSESSLSRATDTFWSGGTDKPKYSLIGLKEEIRFYFTIFVLFILVLLFLGKNVNFYMLMCLFE